jgi:DNA-binding transcriptional LysR family regulator
MSGGDGELRGPVRLVASEFIGAIVLPPMLARFARRIR